METIESLMQETESLVRERAKYYAHLKEFVNKAFEYRPKWEITSVDGYDSVHDYVVENSFTVTTCTRHEDITLSIWSVEKCDDFIYVSGEVCGSEYDNSEYEDMMIFNDLPNLDSIMWFILEVINIEKTNKHEI